MSTAMVGVASSILWGYLSDLTGKPRLLIAFGVTGALIAAQFIPLVSSFSAFLIISCLGSMLNSAPGTLSDSTALSLLGTHREDYGRYRLGGSIGYIITAFSAGFIFEKTGLGVMFPAYGLVMTGFAIVALLLPPVQQHVVQKKVRGEISQMIRQPAWILFIACVFLCWIAVNASIMFLSVSLSTMGASQSLIGMVSTISAIAEMPFMLYSGWFLRRYGPVRLLSVAMGLMMVRYLLLGLMPSPIWALAINPINGPAFAFFWNSAINHANKMAPPHLAGTAQGLLISATSLAGVLSSLLTGWLFDQLGPSGIFYVMSACCLTALILFTSGNLVRRPAQVA